MNIISDIWNGNIAPRERNIIPTENEKHLSAQIREVRNRLFSELSEEARSQLDTYESLLLEKQSASDEETFVYAFRLGAQLMLEAIGKAE